MKKDFERDLSLRLRTILLMLMLGPGLLPSCQSAGLEPGRSIDDALLLALAAHEQLELGQPVVRSGGGVWMAPALAPFAARRTNPHRQLQSMYADFAGAIGEGGPGFDHFLTKAQEHRQAGDALDSSRARREARRGRGFQRFIRGLAQAPVKVTRGAGQLLKGTLRVTGTVIAIAIEQAPQIARDIVRQKLRELRNILQGKIDLAWDKVAAKLGLPFALWLRSKVDPAFVRVRDRFVRNLLGTNRKPPQPTATTKAGKQPGEQETPGYGNWDVDLFTDDEACGAGFTWSNYWANLPAQDLTRDDCQPALDSTHHVDFFFEPGMTIPLRFELDSGQLKGGFDVRSFENLVDWETVEGSLSAEIEDGWVRPRADNQGWDFGGMLVVDVRGVVGLECTFFPDDPMSPAYNYWMNDDKRTAARTEFSGSTFQFVGGNGDEPGRVTSGGTIDLTAGTPYEGGSPPEPMLFIWCEDQSLPSDFPPPVPTTP